MLLDHEVPAGREREGEIRRWSCLNGRMAGRNVFGNNWPTKAPQEDKGYKNYDVGKKY